jgi:hypothetical protein
MVPWSRHRRRKDREQRRLAFLEALISSSMVSDEGLATSQAVSRRPLTAEARVAPGSIHVGFVVDKVALDRFSQSTSVSRANI